MTGFDHVVVGAGSAGCVVAARLAEAGCRTLLLEAGPMPAETTAGEERLRDASRLVLDGASWDHTINVRTAEEARRRGGVPRWARWAYPLGRTLGGSSAVNGCLALPPLRRDFDAWADAGIEDWSWPAVLPWLQRAATGPLTITRPRLDALHPIDEAFVDACRSRGVPTADLLDLSATERPGGADGPAVGAIPSTSVDGVRVDVATAYLGLGDPLLTVRTSAVAHRVVVEHGRVRGVEVSGPAGREFVPADAVTVSAGALGTPAVLQRSGIGDPALLHELGLAVASPLPGVGQGLTDHASVVIWATCTYPHRDRERWRDVAALLPAGSNDGVDVMIGTLHDVDTDAIPALSGRLATGSVVGISTMLMRPSSRGSVRCTGSEPGQPLAVELGMLTEEEDLADLAAGVATAWELLSAPGIRDHLTKVEAWGDRVVADPTTLRSAVRNLAAPAWHPTGTAAMGPDDDPRSVVDARCRVRGVEGLTVVDAALFPTIPSTPTNLTTVAVAERAAALLANQVTSDDPADAATAASATGGPG